MRSGAWLCAFALCALLAWTAAGPYLAARAIGDAVRDGNAAALARRIDLPALRGNLKRQLEGELARRAGDGVRAHPLGAVGLALAGSVAGAGVDAMTTPLGLGALMEGHALWNRVGDIAAPRPAAAGAPPPADPLQGARYRYESPSRFGIALDRGGAAPVVLVLTRRGITWKLSDIRLPLE